MAGVNTFAVRMGRFVSRHPWIVLLITLAVFAAIGPSARHLSFNDDYRVYFSPENPDLLAWDNLLDTYTRADGVTVVVSGRNGEKVFSPEMLKALTDLTERLWNVPYVVRVDSITNFQHIISAEDEITVVDLVTRAQLDDPVLLAEREAVARSEPQIDGLMLSADGTVSAIYLQMMIPKVDNAIADATEKLRDIVSKIETAHPSVEVRLGGLVMLNSAFDEYARQDMATLFPGMVGVIVLITILLLRSLSLSSALILTMFIGIGITMGIAGLIGIAFSPHSSIAPQVVMTIAIATGIHIALGLRRSYAKHGDKEQAVIETLRRNLVPVAITSLTTCIGFASMLFSDVPPFQDLGVMCGVGMLVAFVSMVTLMPALFVLFPSKPSCYEQSRQTTWPTRLAGFIETNRLKVLAAVALMFVPIVMGLAELEINDHPVRLFAKSTDFRQAADYIDEHLAGTTTIQFSLDAGGNDRISDPDYLSRIERFKAYLLDDAMVHHVSVITDTLKRINQAMHGGDSAYYRLPDSKVEAGQYLLFYEMNLPFGLDLNNQINVSKSSVRLIATVKSSSSQEITGFLDRTRVWLEQNDPDFKARGVSVLVMFALMHEHLAVNMLATAVGATLSIVLVLMIVFRNWKIGLLSAIPNLMPIAAVFGLWSLSGNTLDFAASLIFSMTLGVVVDDTVHFLSKFLDAMRHGAESATEAVREAIHEVAPAILYSTLILCSGFLVFGLSKFHMNVTLGLLSALTFAVAAILDLLLLPVLLSLAFPGRREGKASGSTAAVQRGNTAEVYCTRTSLRDTKGDLR